MPTESGLSFDLVKSYKMDLVHKLFVGTADENYITSRWCFFSAFYTDFFWLAVHALEKYLKAVLLLNGSTSKKYQHNIVKLYSNVKPIGGDLLPEKLTAPEGLETSRDASLEDFFAYLYARGNAHNRYMVYGYSAHEQDIFMVDKMVFALRRLTVPLDDPAFPPHVKSAITYRQRLTAEPNYFPDLLLPLEALIKNAENSPARVAAFNLNLTAFTPDDFEHTTAPIARFAFANPVIDRRIFVPLQSGDAQIAAKGLQIAEWCLENITLPNGKWGDPDVVKEIKDAMAIARKTTGRLGTNAQQTREAPNAHPVDEGLGSRGAYHIARKLFPAAGSGLVSGRSTAASGQGIVRERLPMRLRRVVYEALCPRPKPDAAALQLLHGLYEVSQRPRQPVQFPHYYQIALADKSECVMQPWSISTSTGRFIGEDAFTRRRTQGIHLQVEILVEGRDTRIADEHCFSAVIETRSSVAVFSFNFNNSFRE